MPRVGITDDDLATLARDRLDARAVVDYMRSAEDTWGRAAGRRFANGPPGSQRYQIPASIRCDRSWLRDVNDAIYVDRMDAFLWKGTPEEPPFISVASVFVCPRTLSERQRAEWKTALSLSVISKSVVSYDDHFALRHVNADDYRVSHASAPWVVPSELYLSLIHI